MNRVIFAVACIAVLGDFGAALAVAPGGSPPVLAPASDQPTSGYIVIKLNVCRIHGDIEGETSLTDNIRVGITADKMEVQKGGCTFFTVPNLTVGGVKLTSENGRWSWDGKEKPPRDSRVELLTSPKVAVSPPNGFEIAIGSPQPIEYFERRPDGLFELKTVQEDIGLRLKSANVERGADGRIVLQGFSIRLGFVQKREPVEGTSLDVGRPVVKTQVIDSTLAVKPDQDYGMLLSSDGYGSVIMQFRVEVQKGK